ncbi:hypothetical protein [Candidatus Nitrospira neomarina]|uniref:Uncharacterized protein n=1 Tax=Candidatus Nitrospira neomarina TaxID=3020899 RepID=A0AA96GMJ8_9BACT|nr:hypothetical protein [Candidatus Nitrospira neomarina]WNM63190.1 hypothetical protein PQG83_05405 [Candidatus Nitrospira neomarina]
MTLSALIPDTIFALSSRIHVLPVVHGSGDMAHVVREIFVSRHIDCVALPLPPSVQSFVEKGIDQLPVVSLVVLPEQHDDGTSSCSYVPIDPCQPVIMGIRAAMSEMIPRAYVDREVRRYHPVSWVGPDPYSLKAVPLAAFSAATMPFLPPPQNPSSRWDRIRWMAFRLHELELDFSAILFLCPMTDWPWLRQAYHERMPYISPEQNFSLPEWWKVEPSSLYFVLSELPYVTHLYEQRREEARADTHLAIDGIKELVLEARARWLASRSPIIAHETNWVTPQLLQRYFQYVRNLTLLEHRLKPDLYTLVLAAKQMAGDEFALRLLETAKIYDYQNQPSVLDTRSGVLMGIGELQDPGGNILPAVNRLQGDPFVWRRVTLRPDPSRPKTQAWAQQWNPSRQCSWPPEDQRIESFASHVRQHSRQVLGADLGRVERFNNSLEDGIDLRATLRQWAITPQRSVRDIHVKVVPPMRGTIEALVFFFEVPADPQKFSWQTTWYAEHQEESTLSFYATPFSPNMVGPGIGQACYGGALFLFPPRLIPDIWENPLFDFATSLEERLLAGACAHSQEPVVAVVSPVPLTWAWRKMARRFGRKLLPIPLHRFSGQTIARLRQFHVLNGHEIRSYASKFIRE